MLQNKASYVEPLKHFCSKYHSIVSPPIKDKAGKLIIKTSGTRHVGLNISGEYGTENHQRKAPIFQKER